MAEDRTMGTVAPQPLKGVLWFGTTGVALMLGGVVALLAANWHTVPFEAQVAVALAPLVTAWAAYAVTEWRGVRSLAARQVLGTLWAGGVVCAIALLGRVLQLSSSAFAFCAAVAALLLPVVYATRATAAWMAAWAFGIATAVAADGPGLGWSHRCDGMLGVGLLLLGTAAMLPCVARFWREEGLYAKGQRWLAALMAVIATAFLISLLGAWLRDTPWLFPAQSLAAFLPLGVGAWAERRHGPGGRPLSLLGLLIPMWGVLAAIAVGAFATVAVPLWWVAASVALTVGLGRWVLRNEGGFLLLLPMMALALFVGRRADCVGPATTVGALLVGGAALAYGVHAGKRMVANLGLVFTLLAAWCGFVAMRADLMLQGVLLIAGGVGLVAVNLILSRLAKGGRHA